MGGMGALWGEGGSLWVGVDSWWVEGDLCFDISGPMTDMQIL